VVLGMSLYDTFVDGNRSVQLKSFGCTMAAHKVGDTILLDGFQYPETCAFECFAQKGEFVLFERNVFRGIRKDLPVDTPVYDCSGVYLGKWPNLNYTLSTGEEVSRVIEETVEEVKESKRAPETGAQLLCNDNDIRKAIRNAEQTQRLIDNGVSPYVRFQALNRIARNIADTADMHDRSVAERSKL